MGLGYLNGRARADVTRQERSFCQHLFSRILQGGLARFLAYLNSQHAATLDLAANWDLAYEACFYRDLWVLRGRVGVLFSPKRTFDLCLLSDNAMVVLEAKADQPLDDAQLRCFDRDKQQLTLETGVSGVLLAGLASSRYAPPNSVLAYFDGPLLTWKEMAALYEHDPILSRADALYSPERAWTASKNNSAGHLTGTELMAAPDRGEDLCVGRSGRLNGPTFAEDIVSGNWRRQRYETNHETDAPPNRNWFWLSESARRARLSRDVTTSGSQPRRSRARTRRTTCWTRAARRRAHGARA